MDEFGPCRSVEKRVLRCAKNDEVGLTFGGLLGLGGFPGGEVAGSPHVPGGDGAPGTPAFGAFAHGVGFAKEGGGDLGGGFEALEGEGEAFADGVVVDGEDIGAAEAEDEEHFDGPAADAADLREVLDDLVIGHATNTGEGGDGAVEGFGGKVAEGKGFIAGETGGAELFVGAVKEVLGGGVGAEAGDGLEGVEEAAVDGGGGLAVELLVDDGLGEGLEGGLGAGEPEGEGAGALNEAAQFGVGGGERGEGGGDVVSGSPGSSGVRTGHGGDDTWGLWY